MNFTPNDLQNLSFKKGMMGYNEDMVNDVLDKVIEDYSEYIRQNMELKDKVEIVNQGLQQYKSIERSLQDSLVVAQKTGEEVKKNAYDKAETIIKEAQLKAQNIIVEAQEEVNKIKREYMDIKNKIKVFRSKCESLIYSQLDLFKQFTDD